MKYTEKGIVILRIGFQETGKHRMILKIEVHHDEVMAEYESLLNELSQGRG